MRFNVLDHGFVRLDGFMGGTNVICRCARVSTGSSGTSKENDELIDRLMKAGHHTPFEHCVFRFHVKAPIFVTRQWIRHRIGTFSEASGRYREIKPEFYIPETWRNADKTKGIGRDYGLKSSRELENICNDLRIKYKEWIGAGVSREMARMVLPLNLYTEFYWTINCRSLMNFVNLRADTHSQKEMQDYGVAVAKCFKAKLPVVFLAFMNHYYGGSNIEMFGCSYSNSYS